MEVDWWTIGTLLYEMLTGLPPFYDENVQEMYQKILFQPLTFPPEVSAAVWMLLCVHMCVIRDAGSPPHRRHATTRPSTSLWPIRRRGDQGTPLLQVHQLAGV